MRERDFYLAFSFVLGIGPKTFLQLMNYFKFAEKNWNASGSNFSDAVFKIRVK
jgi:hypothetical protein